MVRQENFRVLPSPPLHRAAGAAPESTVFPVEKILFPIPRGKHDENNFHSR